jgi:myo-inositol catabolism protein IolC
MSPAEQIIKKAAEMITAENWIRGRLATDKYGCSVLATAANACFWCAEGYILKASYELSLMSYRSDVFLLLDKYMRKQDIKLTLFAYNDLVAASHQQIKDLFLGALKDD